MIRAHFDLYYKKKVQLFLIWNYDFDGRTEYSFMAGTDQGNTAFGLIREYNDKIKADAEK